jgi:hypothetical protein
MVLTHTLITILSMYALYVVPLAGVYQIKIFSQNAASTALASEVYKLKGTVSPDF